MRTLLFLLAFVAPTAVAQDEYTFLSGQDVYDALVQDSMIVQGYVLGVVDALKDQPQGCFAVPYQADADQVIYAALMEQWSQTPPTGNSIDAIVEVMRARFLCDATD